MNLNYQFAEITLAANVRGTSVIISQLDFVKNRLNLKPLAVIADCQYDSDSIIEYIVANLGSRPRISINPQRGVPSYTKLSSSGVPICIVGF